MAPVCICQITQIYSVSIQVNQPSNSTHTLLEPWVNPVLLGTHFLEAMSPQFQIRVIQIKSVKLLTHISKKKKKSLEIIRQIHFGMTSLGSAFCFNTVKLSSYPLSF